jgi:hypothetical protein
MLRIATIIVVCALSGCISEPADDAIIGDVDDVETDSIECPDLTARSTHGRDDGPAVE